jgi:hypothetical protein
MFMGLIALDDVEIVNRVQLVMNEKGISTDRLYTLLGIYEQKWTGWKKRGIPADWHYSFAKTLGVNMEWLLAGDGEKYSTHNNYISENKTNYQTTGLSDKEIKTLSTFRKMADFQQIEWLAIGEKMADEADRFRKALTPHFENGKMDD